MPRAWVDWRKTSLRADHRLDWWESFSQPTEVTFHTEPALGAARCATVIAVTRVSAGPQAQNYPGQPYSGFKKLAAAPRNRCCDWHVSSGIVSRVHMGRTRR